MSWFKIDDGFGDHPKVLAAGRSAIGVWAIAGSWCAKQLTDGVILTQVARRIGTPRDIATLLKVGLWEPHPDGYLIHDYLEYNPSREQVLRERAEARERQRRHREQRQAEGVSRRDIPVTNGVRHPHPDPTRPVEEHLQSPTTPTVDKLNDWTREHLI